MTIRSDLRQGLLACSLLASLVLTGPVGAADPPAASVSPTWRAKPSGDQVARYYPAEATDRSIGGKTTVRCKIDLGGDARDCEVLSELPYGMGFGKAGVRLMQNGAQFTPAMRDGKPVEETVVVPIVFRPPREGVGYIIYQPTFSQAPSFEDMARVWPAGVSAPEATAALRCTLTADGALDKCIVAGATIEGFGTAAKSLTGAFRMKMTPEEAKEYARSDVLISFQFFNPSTPEGRAATVTDPRWITSIRAEKVLEVYPPQAAEAGIKAGRGVADCLVAADGRLTDCKVAREKPGGVGFGASAVAIAQLMQMNPWTDRGRPVAGARIKLPVDFNLAPEAETGP
jgi:TonB family protein